MLKSNSIKLVLAGILFSFLAGYAGVNLLTKPKSFRCETDVTVNISSDDRDPAIKGTIHIIIQLFHQAPGYVSEYGVITHGENKYLVDRHASLTMKNNTHKGYVAVSRDRVDKNPKDTLPEAIYNELTSNQKVFYYRITNVRDNIWQIQDPRRTILICRA